MNRTLIILWCVVGVLALTLLWFFFRNSTDNETDLRRQLIEKDNQLLKEKDKRIDLLMKVNDAKDSTIKFHESNAKNFFKEANKNQVFYVENKKKYEAIPANVRNLTDDSLQRAIEQYYNR